MQRPAEPSSSSTTSSSSRDRPFPSFPPLSPSAVTELPLSPPLSPAFASLAACVPPAPLPFAPTAAVIPSAHGPIPVSDPAAYDAAATYSIVLEVFTNQVATNPHQFPPLPNVDLFAPGPPPTGSFAFFSAPASATASDSDDDEEEDRDYDPRSDARFCTLVVESYVMVERPATKPAPSSARRNSTASAAAAAAEAAMVAAADLPPSGDASSLLFPPLLFASDSGDGSPSAASSSRTSARRSRQRSGSRDPPSRKHADARRQAKRDASPTPRARFEATHEGTAHISCGILHLYRHVPTSSTESATSPSSATAATAPTTIHTASSHLLALLGVPLYFSTGDLITWLGPYADHVSHLRMVRDHLPHRYLVLLRFRDGNQARAFFAERNGRAFSAFEPQLAVVVKVTSLTFAARSMPPFAFPHDVLLLDPAGTTSAAAVASADAQQQQQPAAADLSRPLSGHEPGSIVGIASDVDLHELPTCPLCLERMDAGTSGILTILCQHSFHCGCLRRWDDETCPVCRYTQPRQAARDHLRHPPPSTPPPVPASGARAKRRDTRSAAAAAMSTALLPLSSSSSSSSSSSDSESISPAPPRRRATSDIDFGETDDSETETPGPATACRTCGSAHQLWVCLICGDVGCGRYTAGHAHDHYAATRHAFALELDTQRVWDYARDTYVHRLVQAGPDGKLVEVAPPPASAAAPVLAGLGLGGGAGSSASVAAVAGAAASSSGGPMGAPPPGYVLIAEADVQRINKEYAWLLQSQVDAHRQVLDSQITRLSAWADSVRTDARDALRRAARAEASAAAAQAALREEQQVSSALLRANRELKDRDAARDAEIAELQEQVRDLMMFLETREKIERAPEKVQRELAEASAVVQPGTGAGSGAGGGAAKGKRKGKGRR
ncbi:hypothetical protein H9P43_002076 [Blastocladiella emersonii ATCC 22665]|nr:hypothetical protein H9P43_002076 [Blastocladiella emersonii ATCC 22665]